MKKELVVYIEGQEEGELVKINKLAGDREGDFLLLSLGSNRIVVETSELLQAVGAIGHYSNIFEHEEKMAELRKKGPPPAQHVQQPSPEVTVKAPKKGAVKTVSYKSKENEFVLEAPMRDGPTDSELALQEQMKLMQGESIVIREK